MATPPRSRGIQREALPDAPSWFEPVLQHLNEFMAQSGLALQGQLTVGENLAAFYKEATVRAPAVSWTRIALAGTWADYGFSAAAGLRVEADGVFASSRGFLTKRPSAGAAAGEMIGTMPAAFAPPDGIVLTADSNSAAGKRAVSIVITAAGGIQLNDALTTFADVSLDGLRWPLATPLPPSAPSSAGWPIRIPNQLGVAPRHVAVSQALDADTQAPVSCGTPAWNMAAGGAVSVHYVPGLVPGRNYRLRFLIQA